MFANGSLIVVGVVVLVFFGLVLSIRTRKGGEIDEHPSEGLSHDGGENAPQAKGGDGTIAHDDGERALFDSHGTQ